MFESGSLPRIIARVSDQVSAATAAPRSKGGGVISPEPREKKLNVIISNPSSILPSRPNLNGLALLLIVLVMSLLIPPRDDSYNSPNQR